MKRTKVNISMTINIGCLQIVVPEGSELERIITTTPRNRWVEEIDAYMRQTTEKFVCRVA